MEINKSNNTKINDVDFNSVKFGEIFTDHMFECNFKNGEWESPIIKPYSNLKLDPSTHVFHYGQAIFEGMKGYKDKNNTWIIDPIDGTANFLHGIPHFAISIGLEKNKEIISGII